jgi:hypothetical protein
LPSHSAKERRTTAPRRGRWTQGEIDRLKELYGRREEAALARELGRPLASVRRMAAELFPVRDPGGPWTDAETEQLKSYLGATAPEVIGRILGRPAREVEERIGELGREKHTGRWSREEIVRFKRVYGTRTDEDLSRIFERDVDAIRSMADRLALAKDKAFLRRLKGESATRMPRWTDAELVVLREMYPTAANLEIARRLSRSVKSVVSKAHHLGLKKDEERLRAMGRENVALRYRSEG